MIHYERTNWYGFSYLLQRSGSLLPRCLPLMMIAGAIAGFFASGIIDEWTGYAVLDVFGHRYSMSLFGLVFGYLSIARLNISYNRYWEGSSNLKQMHSKWFDAFCQAIAFDQQDYNQPELHKEPWCLHLARLFAQLSAMATLILHSEEEYVPER